jgi:hypothetical protein
MNLKNLKKDMQTLLLKLGYGRRSFGIAPNVLQICVRCALALAVENGANVML